MDPHTPPCAGCDKPCHAGADTQPQPVRPTVVRLETVSDPDTDEVLTIMRNALSHTFATGAVAAAVVVVHKDGSIGSVYHTGNGYFQLLGGVTELQHRMQNDS